MLIECQFRNLFEFEIFESNQIMKRNMNYKNSFTKSLKKLIFQISFHFPKYYTFKNLPYSNI
jgi:hypothetical protein